MPPMIVYHEFESGEEELGIMTLECDYQLWVHVGDFDYLLNWNSFEAPFTVIGFL